MEYSNINDEAEAMMADANDKYVVEEALHEEEDEVYDFAIRFENGAPLYFKFGEREGEVKVCAKRRGFDYYKNYLEMPTGVVRIPGEVEYRGRKYKVTEIEGHAFHNCTKVLQVVVPNTVTRIGEFAFFFCVSLTGVVIPETVEEIGGFSFESCQSLREFRWPKSVKRIERSMFCGSDLAEIMIPDTVEEIGEHAFHGCENLKEVVIPKSVKRIGDKAFVDCNGLRVVRLEGEVERGEHSFPEGCEVVIAK